MPVSPNPPPDKQKLPDLLNLFEHSLIKKVPSIIEFAESSEFCSNNEPKYLYPRQRTLLKVLFLEELDDYDHRVLQEWENSSSTGGEVTMGPKVYDRIKYLKDNGFPHFRQIMLVGGRRSGKSHMIGLMVAYKTYCMSLLDNVGDHYGIDADKDIYFAVLGGSLEQTKQTVFNDARNWVLSCKPFNDQQLINKVLAESISVFTPYDKQRVLKLQAQQGRVDADLAKLKVKAYGTNSRTVRGFAFNTLVFDEFAHYLAGESRMSDEEVYTSALPATRQFGKDSLIIYSSSPYQKIGMFYKLYEQALKLEPADVGEPVTPDMFMLQFPSWELFKDWETDPIHKWAGAIVVDPKYDVVFAREETANPESFKVEYRSHFAEVIDAFLNPDKVDEAFSPEITKQKLGRYIKTEWGAQGYTMYCGHGDPSSTGANFGIAIAHIEDVVEEILNADGTPTGDNLVAPHVVFDVVHAFYPEDFPNRTIDWLEVLPAIETMINAFRPFQFTFDQFDSLMPIQKLQRDLGAKGIFETHVFEKTATAGSNLKMWMSFKAALNLGRVHAPHPTYPNEQQNKRSLELATQELKYLQFVNGKVEKQEIGPCRTNDIAVCLANVVDSLVGDFITQDFLSKTKPEYGGLGGYGIGARAVHDSPFSEQFSHYYKNMPENMPSHRGGRFIPSRRKRF